MYIINKIGRYFLDAFARIGKFIIFTFNAILLLFTGPLYLKNIFNQMVQVGYYSIPVVGMTAIFTGAVLALQSYTGFSRFSAEGAIATIVVLSITRELGPVLTALMVISRVGASMAAEIATMKVTEQIDALTTLSTNPIKYLVTPRIIATILVMPCLVIIADIIGIMGGYLISVYKLNFNSSIYLSSTFKYLEVKDVTSGLIKSIIFGLIISSTSCYYGFNSKRGAQGVGEATTNAVVISSLLILLSNYFVTETLFNK